MRRAALGLSALFVLSVSFGAAAQGKPKPLAPLPAPPPSAGPTLAQLAAQISTQLGGVPKGALVAAGPLRTDQDASRADELVQRVVARVAASVPGSSLGPAPATMQAARTAAARSTAVVYLQVELQKGVLRITADEHPVVSNGWDRVRNPQPPPRAHAFAQAPIDAEVRTMLAPIALERSAVHRYRQDDTEIAAIACGDVDGDGGLELLVVSRSKVALGRFRNGHLLVERTALFAQLGPRAPVPLREPLGAAAFSTDASRLFVAHSDHGAYVLDGDLRAAKALPGFPISFGSSVACARLQPEQSAFDGPLVRCDPSAPETLYDPRVGPYDAAQVIQLRAPTGAERVLSAVREPGGRLRLRMGEAQLTIDGAGAQFVIGDLDLDGWPEIVTSSEGADDAVHVQTWDGTQLRTRLRLAAPAGVRAFGICPAEERGMPALVAAVGAELWVVR